MARRHSWDVPIPASSALETVRTWAEPVEDDVDSDSDSDFDPEERAKSDALFSAEMLLDSLLESYVEGKSSAKIVCVTCFWAKHAGITAQCIADFALKPSSPSGHFQRKMDSVLGTRLKPNEMLELQVPCLRKHDLSRSLQAVPVLAPHEIVERELEDNPDLLDTILERSKDGDWHHSYTAHPIVSSACAPVVGMALYVDGVPFVKKDSVLGFYLYVLGVGRRHLIATLRKSELCKCGCHGWCTLVQIWHFIRWSLEACCEGVWPRTNPYGKPWVELDSKHFSKQGMPLSAKSALIHIKGDWAEFANSFGFLTWSHVYHPCLFCWTSRDDMYKTEGLSPLATPSPLVTQHQYDAACTACEIWVTVNNKEQHGILIGSLRFDKRKTGHGRTLQRDLPMFGLLSGDRLEPHPGLLDVGSFEAVALPARTLFWRSSLETLSKHRCPIFSYMLGVSVQIMEIDTLHCLNLGVYMQYATDVVWHLHSCDVFSLAALRTAEERIQLFAMRLRGALFDWYDGRGTEQPPSTLHKLQDFTAEMLGSAAHPKLKLKAAETKTFMQFALYMASRFRNKITFSESLVEGGTCLVRMQHLFDDHGEILPAAAVQDLAGSGLFEEVPRIYLAGLGWKSTICGV
jgi:hypothetical protein